MSPRAHQTPPDDTGGHDDTCTCQKCYPGWGAAHFPHDWPAGIDWPLPSHPEYPPEDEALVVPRDDNQKENDA